MFEIHICVHSNVVYLPYSGEILRSGIGCGSYRTHKFVRYFIFGTSGGAKFGRFGGKIFQIFPKQGKAINLSDFYLVITLILV